MFVRSFGFGLILVFSLARVAFATSFIDTPFPELVKDAPTVVHGKIGTSSSDWVTGEDSSRRLFTFYQVQVDETFKGNVSGSSITIREMGGEKDGVGMQVAGAAQFTRGEDVVLLLSEQNKDGSYEIRGLASGKFGVRRQENGKECLSGMGMTLLEGEKVVHTEEGIAPPSTCLWTLSSLRKLVKDQSSGSDTAVKAGVSPLPSPLDSRVISDRKNAAPQASQLQSAPTGEQGYFTAERIWILVLIFGLVGLVAVLRTKPRR